MSGGRKERDLAVRVNAGDGPIHGSIDDGTGARPFWGWLELLRAFEQAAHPVFASEERRSRERHALRPEGGDIREEGGRK
jgi:hypothetical protein